MNTVRIPSALRPYTGGQREIEVGASTVEGALEDLARRYPDIRSHLYDEKGHLRPFVNLFVNQVDVRQLDGTSTPLREGDRLIIVPSIAGGSAG